MADTNRIHWLDNLRSITIFMVLLYHVGGVYEAAGLWGWFWIVDDPSTITWVGIVGILFDIMVMPIMFFIAGYMTPPSMWYKSEQEFLEKKFKRLVVPWMIAVILLIPLYKVIFLFSRSLPQEHWSTYFHITSQNSQNWLWFLPVLFSFDIIYTFIAKSRILYKKLPLKYLIAGIFLLSMTFSVIAGLAAGHRSWTLSPIIDFENERILLYVLVFLLGAFFKQQDLFKELSAKKNLYNIVTSVAWIPICVHIGARLVPFFYPEDFSITSLYLLVWWFSFNLSLLALMYIMIESFRRFFDKPGKIWDALNRNSYGVYIIHVIVIGVFGTLLLHVNIPAVLKYLSLIVLTYAVSNLLVSAYRGVVKRGARLRKEK
ncbi:MAG: acyltransferase [Candidatus Marinimicrobia bacterium]|nr:acyltransferase [Candidatus Neomarinimicrobiota bacterium]